MRTEEPILTISIASNLLKLHPRTLMLYEKAKLISPFRTDTQRRLFSIKNLEELQFIKYLTQMQGVNLKGARVILEAIRSTEEEGINLKKKLFPLFKPAKLL
jgi:MerR family transcriptional regulator/heat shock protein HspR